MKQTDIAQKNFDKFWTWLNEKYPPISRYEKVHISDAGNGMLNVYYCFQMGQLKTRTSICQIPTYPMFDINFNPNEFYKDETPHN